MKEIKALGVYLVLISVMLVYVYIKNETVLLTCFLSAGHRIFPYSVCSSVNGLKESKEYN